MKTDEIKTYATGMSWAWLAAQVWDPSGGDNLQPDQAFIQMFAEPRGSIVFVARKRGIHEHDNA